METRLKIQLTNLKSYEGHIGILLFSKPDGFPGDHTIAYKKYYFTSAAARSVIVLDNIPYGTYAISVLHDKNENNKMDYNLLGMPLEGFGTSGQSGLKAVIPFFNKASFEISQPEHLIHVKMNYLL
ncbi:DUF2141 domain-containing protein [Bacteroidota bacterium]